MIGITANKLFEHGYTLLRSDDSMDVPKIKYSNYHGVWKTLSKHKSKAERDREMLRLMKENEKYLID